MKVFVCRSGEIGRRPGLKIPCDESHVPVRARFPAPILLFRFAGTARQTLFHPKRQYRGVEQLVARRAHNPEVVRFKSHPRNQHCEPKKISVRKTQKPQGLSLKGTKIDQWVKAGTGQEKIRSSKRWSDFSLYTDENSSEVTTISELFGFYEFIFGVIPMLSSSSASSCRLWTFSFLYAFLR